MVLSVEICFWMCLHPKNTIDRTTGTKTETFWVYWAQYLRHSSHNHDFCLVKEQPATLKLIFDLSGWKFKLYSLAFWFFYDFFRSAYTSAWGKLMNVNHFARLMFGACLSRSIFFDSITKWNWQRYIFIDNLLRL